MTSSLGPYIRFSLSPDFGLDDENVSIAAADC